MDQILRALPAVVLIMGFLLIRLLRVFTQHQQRMAEILNQTSADRTDIDSLRRELADIKVFLNDHVITSDGKQTLTAPPPSPDLSERLRAQTQ